MTTSTRLDRLEASAKELSAATGGQCIPLQADVRNPKQLQDAVAKTVEKYGRIDFVICGPYSVPPAAARFVLSKTSRTNCPSAALQVPLGTSSRRSPTCPRTASGRSWRLTRCALVPVRRRPRLRRADPMHENRSARTTRSRQRSPTSVPRGARISTSVRPCTTAVRNAASYRRGSLS